MKKIIAVILVLGMVILAGCGRIPDIDAQENPEITQNAQTEPETNLDDIEKSSEPSEGHPVTDKPSDSSGFEAVESPTEDDSQAPEAKPAEDTDIPSQSEPTAPTQESSANPAKGEDYIIVIGPQDKDPTESSVPEQEPENTAPVPEPTQTPDPEPTPPQTSEPAPEQPTQPVEPEPTPEPTPEPAPEPEPEPAFDVSVWVSFAQSYGQQVGLSYDSTATACWDNPILASAKSIYLERDITSRLDRYVRYGYTAFCVWSEQFPDGRYNIYIGYA